MDYEARQEPKRPEVGKDYSDKDRKWVRVHAVCQSDVVFRHYPDNRLNAIKREEFSDKYLTK